MTPRLKRLLARTPRHCPLSPRQYQVAICAAAGMTAQETADALEIGLRTVETHRDRARETLGCRKTSDLTRYVVQKGWL